MVGCGEATVSKESGAGGKVSGRRCAGSQRPQEDAQSQVRSASELLAMVISISEVFSLFLRRLGTLRGIVSMFDQFYIFELFDVLLRSSTVAISTISRIDEI